MGLYDNFNNAARPAGGVTSLSDVMAPVMGSRQVGQIAGVQDPLAALRQQATTSFQDAARRKQAMSIANGQPQHASGLQGFLQDVMSNPVVETAMKPLQMLDYGRRAVISTFKEIGDAATGNDGNFHDWWKQINDPSFGFGKAISQNWAKKHMGWARAIGFVGDVALDPLTYTTFGGAQASKVLQATGKEMRLVAAQRLLEKGVITEARAMEVAHRGISWLNDAERLALGLDRQGIYFMGKRVAGTGRIAEGLQHSASRLRIMLGDTVLGGKAVSAFTPQAMKEAEQALLRGTGNPELAKDYFNFISAHAYRRAAHGEAVRVWSDEFARTVADMSIEEQSALSTGVHKVLENIAGHTPTDAEVSAAAKIKDLYERMHQAINAKYLEIDPEGGFPAIEGYLTHMRTPEAFDYMRNPANAYVKDLKEVIDNPMDTVGVFKSRMIAGDKFFGQELSQADIAGGVERLNEIARKGGFAGNFFETDVKKILASYVNQYAEQHGVAAFAKHLWEKGTMQSILERQSVDEKMWKSVGVGIDKATDAFHKHVGNTIDSIVKAADGLSEAAAPTFRALGVQADEATRITFTRNAAVKALEDARASLAEAHTAFDNIGAIDLQAGVFWSARDAEMQGIRDTIAKYEALAKGAEDFTAKDIAEVRGLAERIDHYRNMHVQMQETAAIAEEHLRMIAMGKDKLPSGTVEKAVRERLKTAVDDAVKSGDKNAIASANKALKDHSIQMAAMRRNLKQSFEERLQIAGKMEDLIPQTAATQQWWADIAEGLPVRDVKAHSWASIDRIAKQSAAGSVDIHEMRTASAWLLARVVHHYGGVENLPESIARVVWGVTREGGDTIVKMPLLATRTSEGLLNRAGQAEMVFNHLASDTSWMQRGAILDYVTSNVGKIVSDVQKRADTFIAVERALNSELGKFLRSNPAATMSAEGLRKALNFGLKEGEESPLNFLFQDILNVVEDKRAATEALMQPDNIGVSSHYNPAEVYNPADLNVEELGNVGFSTRSGDIGATRPDAPSYGGDYTAEEIYGRLQQYKMKAFADRWDLTVKSSSTKASMVGAGALADSADGVTFTFQQLGADLARAHRLGIDPQLVVDQHLSKIRGLHYDLRQQLENAYTMRSSGRVMRTQAQFLEEVRHELVDSYHHLWFATTVDERWQNIVAASQAYGIIPSQDVFRGIVNQVASSAYTDVAGEAQHLSAAVRTMKQLSDDLGMAATPQQARQLVEDVLGQLGTTGAGRQLALYGGEGYSSELWDEWMRLGGKDKKGGEFRAVNEARKAAGLTKANAVGKELDTARAYLRGLTEQGGIDPAVFAEAQAKVTELQTAHEAAKAEAITIAQKHPELVAKHAAAEKKYQDFLENKLIPWYRSVTNKTGRINKDEIHEFLKVYKNRASFHWADPRGSIKQVRAWVDGTLENLQHNNRALLSRSRLFATAADPFVNAEKVVADFGSRQTLPRMYATKLEELATRLERAAVGIRDQGAIAATAQAGADSVKAAADQLVAQQRAVETGVGIRSQALWGDNLELAAKARTLAARMEKLSNSVEYRSAQEARALHDFKEMLAQFDLKDSHGLMALQPLKDTVIGHAYDQHPLVFAERTPNGEVLHRFDNLGDSQTLEKNLLKFFAEGRDGTWYVHPLKGTQTEEALRAAMTPVVRPAVPFWGVTGYRLQPAGLVDVPVHGNLALTSHELRALTEVHPNVFKVAPIQAEHDALVAQRAELQSGLERLSRRRSTLERGSMRGASEAGVVDRNIKALEEQIFYVDEKIAAKRAEYSAQAAVKNRAYVSTQIDNSRRQMAEMMRAYEEGGQTSIALAADIKDMQAHINELEQQLIIHDPQTLMSAEMKVRQLMRTMRERNIPLQDVEGGMRGTAAIADAATLAKRRDFLKTVWDSSHDSEMLGRMDALRSSAEMELRTSLYQRGNAAEQYQAYVAQVREAWRHAYIHAWGLESDVPADVIRGASGWNKPFASQFGDMTIDRPSAEGAIGQIQQTIKAANEALGGAAGGAASDVRIQPLTMEALNSVVGKTGNIIERPEFLSPELAARYDQAAQQARAAAGTLREATPNTMQTAGYRSEEFLRETANQRRTISRLQAKFDERANSYNWAGDQARPAASVAGKPVDPRNFVQVGTKGAEPILLEPDQFRRLAITPLEEQLAAMEAAMGVQQAEWATKKAGLEATAQVGIKSAEKRVEDATKTLFKATQEFVGFPTYMSDAYAGELGTTIRERMAKIRDLIDKDASLKDRLTGIETGVGHEAGAVEEYRKILADLEESMKALSEVGIKPKQQKTLDKLFADANANLAKISTDSKELDVARALAFPNAEGKYAWDTVTRSIEDGWKSLEAYGLPNTMIKDELWAMLANVKRLNNPASQRELVRFLQPYTKFFKTYATATPGFHVRNGMSNVMTMVASGADIRLFRRSFSLFRDFTDHFTSGGQAAVEAWLAKMPEQERSLFTWSMKAADAAGGGRVDEAIREALSSQGKAADLIYHNRMIRASQHLGHHVEQSARFMLAYDTLVQGMRAGERVGTVFSHEDLFLQAQARVKRYLFDYVDKSAVDESVRQIIPFWTWMSRNVPMQLVNQWTNPRAYAIYQSVVRNFAHDTSGTITPAWLKEAGAFNIGGDTYLQPDFGSTRMDQFMTQLGDPARMASMVNPAIRLPVELLGGRKLYNNSPFSTTPQRVAGGPVSGLTESLLGLIGATDQVGPKGVKDAQGNVIPAGTDVTSDKWNYALMNLLPIFSQAERLFPSTDAYQGKKDASWLSYFGVPVKQVTKGQKDAEVASRKKQIQQLASAAKKLGYTP